MLGLARQWHSVRYRGPGGDTNPTCADAAGKLAESLECFERSLELNKTNDLTYRWKGRVLLKNGRVEEAVSVFDAAIALCPMDSADHLYRRGMAFHGKGDYSKAISCFRSGLEKDPEDVDAWFDCGESLVQLGRTEEALDCYTRAVSLCSGYKKAMRALGRLHSPS